jgi:hypothetical protein
MITTPKTGHFWSPFYAFLDKNWPKSGKWAAMEELFLTDLAALNADLYGWQVGGRCRTTSSSMGWRW